MCLLLNHYIDFSRHILSEYVHHIFTFCVEKFNTQQDLFNLGYVRLKQWSCDFILLIFVTIWHHYVTELFRYFVSSTNLRISALAVQYSIGIILHSFKISAGGIWPPTATLSQSLLTYDEESL
jgi:hypothetical protein